MNKMPVLFIGHGSPMNAIEENEFTDTWFELGKKLQRPRAVLSVSAHWYTDGTRICDAGYPRQIYDMYGFPKELYQLKYPVKGEPDMAQRTMKLIGRDTAVDNSWGIDHGTWSVLCRMYPEADIPVFQLSIDKGSGAEVHYRLGQELRDLREQGVLILGSGNIVHNLSKIDWHLEGGYSWAEEFDGYIKSAILGGSHKEVVNYENAGKISESAFYTPEHYYPLLYILGASDSGDEISVWNEACILGSLSMTSYLFAPQR